MNNPLIDVEELSRRLGEVKLFDLRWSLTDPDHGVNAYRQGHIPGAVFVDLDRQLSAPPGPGRHPLPTLADFEATLGSLGLTADDPVVVYDDVSGIVAARMWWMLRSIGHDRVGLLDGGLQAWVDFRFPLEVGEVHLTPSSYHARHDFTGVARREDLEDRILVDVRAPERYTGEFEPVDPQAGHIPGAVNLPTGLSLTDRGTLKTPDELAALYSGLENPVVSCGSGVNACHTALALVRAGRPLPDLYVGSFSEWSRLGLPVNTGIEP
jgi:thiosulfate/3-mercaptopyruvate sulfurtransferase